MSSEADGDETPRLPADHPFERLRNAAMQAWQSGDLAAAERSLLEALATAEREAAGWEPTAPQSLRLTQALADLGCLYAARGSPAIADRLLVRAVRLVEARPGRGNTPTGVGFYTRLSELRCRPKGYESAEALARRAVEICRRHPALGGAHPDTARALAALGHSLEGQKKFDDAETCFREAMDVCKRSRGTPARTMWLLLADLADLARDRGRHEEALPLYRASLKLRETYLAADHPEVLQALNGLAAAHERLGGLADALPLYERVLREVERLEPPDHLMVADALHRVARTCADGDPARARSLLERTLAIEEKRLPAELPRVETTLRALARIADRQHRPAAAVPLRRRVLELRSRRLGANDPDLIGPVTELCHSHCLAGNWDVAADLDSRALYLAEKSRGFSHPLVGRILDHYARVLHQLGNDDRAAQLAARAASIRSANRGANPAGGPVLGSDRPRDGGAQA